MYVQGLITIGQETKNREVPFTTSFQLFRLQLFANVHDQLISSRDSSWL